MADLERRAQRLACTGEDLEGLCRAFDALLREAVPYAIAAWSTHDPATGLFTSCTMTGLDKDPAREAELFRHEFMPDEPGTYRSLIEHRRTSGVLSEITDGDLDRASRYRHMGRGFGVTDELRLVLWADGLAWGSATLYRTDGRFGPADVERAEAVGPYAAAGMQTVLLRAAAMRPESVAEPPGILAISEDVTVRALTEPADRWLELGGPELATAAAATAAAVRSEDAWEGARSRLLLRDGRMVALHAARMAAEGDVAVIVELARPAEVSALLVDAYGLTERQRDVLGLLLLGRSMAQIASALGISEHTAHDHRKAIYLRIGVSSRSELAGLLQAEQYSPRVASGAVPSPYGGFLERAGRSSVTPSRY